MGKESNIILQCALEKFSLGAILQLLLSERINVHIRIKGAECSGWMRLYKGEVWDAACANLSGRSAAIELLLNERGLLEAKLATTEPKHRIKSPSLSLQMEALRQKDHWANLATLTLKGPPTAGGTSSFELFLLKGLPVVQAAAESGLPRTVALGRVEKLLSEHGWKRGPRVLKKMPVTKVLFEKNTAPEQEIVLDQKTSSVEQPIEEVANTGSDEFLYYAAMDRGMDARKKGDIDEARLAWESALSLRPHDRMAAFNLRRLELLVIPNTSGSL